MSLMNDIFDLTVELERKQKEIEEQYYEKIKEKVIGKKFKMNKSIWAWNEDENRKYKEGDIVKISDIYFYDGHDLGFINEFGDQFDVTDFGKVEFVDVD